VRGAFQAPDRLVVLALAGLEVAQHRIQCVEVQLLQV
jgi:hypothetical protein